MFARALHAAALVLLLAFACNCSNPTAPSGPIYTPPPSPPAQALDIEGEYSLTITASPGCSLPPEVLQRTYTATVREPQKGHVTVTLSGPQFFISPDDSKIGFEGARQGDAVKFVIANEFGSEYAFREQIDDKWLFFQGVADATASDNSIAGWFEAEIRYFAPGAGVWIGSCTATDHRMVFTRHGPR